MNPSLKQHWAEMAAMLAVWCWLWMHLAVEWRLNPQYEYGFAVPVLAALLLWTRLPGTAQAPTSRDRQYGWGLTGLAFLPLLGGEIIRQADPFWRIGGWLLHAGAAALTLGIVLATGGRSWMRAFLVPVLFLTLAVPWPSAIEGTLTNGLLAVATRIAVDCLNWLGIPCLQRGNVIELSNGLVGIDEACSGIQSLLSSLMASVFLGAYLRLSHLRRLVLVFVGVAIAVLGNVIRIVVLTRAVYAEGQAGFEKAHDPVGLWASTGIFLSLGLLAWVLRPRRDEAEPALGTSWPERSLPRAVPLLVAVLAIPLLVTVMWRAVAGGTTDVLARPHWNVRVDPPPAGWQVRADGFRPEEQRLLQFSEGGAWLFQKDMAVSAYVVHLYWSPERTIPSQAFGHSAQICLPSAGWKTLGDPSPLEVTVDGQPIAGSLGYFQLDADRQAVFQATWRGSSLQPAAGQLSTSRWSRLHSLKEAYVRRGHETLTVYLPAPIAAGNPGAAFSTFLSVVLEPNSGRPSSPQP